MYLQADPLAENRTPIHRKMVAGPAGPGGGRQVYVDFAAIPFAALADDDLLDTSDLCQIFGCSARTVYRWIAESELKPSYKVGREWLFSKAEIVRWYDVSAPRPGRPPLQGRSP